MKAILISDHAKWCHEECENRCADDEDTEFVRMTKYAEEEEI